MREASSALHDQLDASMSADLSLRPAYARFLRVQLSARSPIEAWLAKNAPSDLVPPGMAHLLVDDLCSLGERFSLSPVPFAMPSVADPLGAAWALAGSHLGNRAMLARLGKVAADIPTAFLADTSMMQFWKGLLPRLNEEASAAACAGAVVAANNVFHHFLAVEAADRLRLAA